VAIHIVAYTSNRRWYVSPPSVAGSIRWPWHGTARGWQWFFTTGLSSGHFFLSPTTIDRMGFTLAAMNHDWGWLEYIYDEFHWKTRREMAWGPARPRKKVMLECSVPLLCMWHWVSLLVVEWCSEAFSHTLCSLSSSTFRRSNTEGSVEECQTRCIKIARYLDKWGY